jgi:hypothetical protein
MTINHQRCCCFATLNFMRQRKGFPRPTLFDSLGYSLSGGNLLPRITSKTTHLQKAPIAWFPVARNIAALLILCDLVGQ